MGQGVVHVFSEQQRENEMSAMQNCPLAVCVSSIGHKLGQQREEHVSSHRSSGRDDRRGLILEIFRR